MINREYIMQERKKFNENKVAQELEKVEIATQLCNTCTLEEMKYLKFQARLILNKKEVLK